MGEGFCGYSLEFSEDDDDPRSKIVWMAAVDPVACQFEFEIGAIDPIESAPTKDAESVTTDAKARPEDADEAKRDRRGFAHSETVASLLAEEVNAIPTLARRDQKLTIVGRWEDLVGIDINKVLVAVRADTRGNDIVDADCKYAWWWRTGTGWQSPGGDWTDCRSSNTRATALADGHFKNPYFPTCVPDVVHVYNDRLWAKIAPKNNLDHGHYDWGIRGAWAEGARCEGMLHWASFEVIKGEDSTSWIN